MLTFGTGLRVFVGVEPFDMRGSFKSLAGAARRLGLEPVDGHLYLFFNRARGMCKGVWFDGSGWCLYAKRLERGSFEIPSVPEGATHIVVNSAVLTSLLSGLVLGPPRRGWYRRPEE